MNIEQPIKNIDLISKILNNLGIKHSFKPNTNPPITKLDIVINDEGTKDKSGRIYVTPSGAFASHGSMPKKDLEYSNVFYFLSNFHTQTTVEELAAASGLEESEIEYYIQVKSVQNNDLDIVSFTEKEKENIQKEIEVMYFGEMLKTSKGVSGVSKYLTDRGIEEEIIEEEGIDTIISSSVLVDDLNKIENQKVLKSFISIKTERLLVSLDSYVSGSQKEKMDWLSAKIDNGKKLLDEIKELEKQKNGKLPLQKQIEKTDIQNELRLFLEIQTGIEKLNELANNIEWGIAIDFETIQPAKLKNYPVVIPYKNIEGEVQSFFLRKDQKTSGQKYTQIGSSVNEMELNNPNEMVVCEGKMDKLTLKSYFKQHPELVEPSYLVMSKATASLKKEEMDFIKGFRGEVITLLDNDFAGRLATNKILEVIFDQDEKFLEKVVMGDKYFDMEDIFENDINDLYLSDKNDGTDSIGPMFTKKSKYKLEKTKNFSFANIKTLPPKTEVLDISKRYHKSHFKPDITYYLPYKKGKVIKLDSGDLERFLWEDAKDLVSLFYKERKEERIKKVYSLPKSYTEFKKMLWDSVQTLYPEVDLKDPKYAKLKERMTFESDIIRTIHDNMLVNAQNNVGFLQYFFKNKILAEKLEEKGLVYDIRGSAGNFIILSLLGIVKEPLSEIEKKLDDSLNLPERFINPDQLDMPDIDYELPDTETGILEELKQELNLHLPLKTSQLKDEILYSDHPCKHYFDVPGTTSMTKVIPITAKELDERHMLNVDLIKYGGVLNRYQKFFASQSVGYSFMDLRNELGKDKEVSLLTVMENDLPHLGGRSRENLIKLNPNIEHLIPELNVYFHKENDKKTTLFVKNLDGEFVALANGTVLEKHLIDETQISSKSILEIYNNEVIFKNKKEFLTTEQIRNLHSIKLTQKEMTLASALNRPFASQQTFVVEMVDGYSVFFGINNEGKKVVSECGGYELDVNDFNKNFFNGVNKQVQIPPYTVRKIKKDVPIFNPKLVKNKNGKEMLVMKKDLFVNRVIGQIIHGKKLTNFDFLNQSGGLIIYQEQLIIFLRKIIELNYGAVSHEWNKKINVLRKFVSKSDTKVKEEEKEEAKHLIDTILTEIGSIKDRSIKEEALGVFNAQFASFMNGPYLFSYEHAKHVGNQAQNVGWLIEMETKQLDNTQDFTSKEEITVELEMVEKEMPLDIYETIELKNKDGSSIIYTYDKETNTYNGIMQNGNQITLLLENNVVNLQNEIVITSIKINGKEGLKSGQKRIEKLLNQQINATESNANKISLKDTLQDEGEFEIVVKVSSIVASDNKYVFKIEDDSTKNWKSKPDFTLWKTTVGKVVGKQKVAVGDTIKIKAQTKRNGNFMNIVGVSSLEVVEHQQSTPTEVTERHP